MKHWVAFFTLLSCFLTEISATPYISGDRFREYADFIFDRSFSPKEIHPGSTIFVKGDMVDRFFREFHPKIQCPYILITHNSDFAIPGANAKMLDEERLIAWFGQNVEGHCHPKLHPIPIGIANKQWKQGDQPLFDLLRSRLETFKKKPLLYMNFSINTYPLERKRVYDLFVDKSFCLTASSKDFRSYLIDTACSYFVLSPRGNGLDCHRTWEALYMGAIPLVRTSMSDQMYEGLPVVIIQDWEEVTEAFLQKTYEEMSRRQYFLEKMYADYWFKLIDSYKISFNDIH